MLVLHFDLLLEILGMLLRQVPLHFQVVGLLLKLEAHGVGGRGAPAVRPSSERTRSASRRPVPEILGRAPADLSAPARSRAARVKSVPRLPLIRSQRVLLGLEITWA